MEPHAPSEASTTSAAAANAAAYAVAATKNKMCTIGDTSAKHVYLSSPHKGMV